MSDYEILYILDAKLKDEKREAEIEKISGFITSLNGKVDKITKTAPWGLRKFAYIIDNTKKEGFYVLMSFSVKAEAIVELERRLRLQDAVVRYKISKKI